MSCAPLVDKGPTGYIEIKKTKNKIGEAKANNKKKNEQKHEKKNIKTTHKQNLTVAVREHSHLFLLSNLMIIFGCQCKE
jgi:hypothetical protein